MSITVNKEGIGYYNGEKVKYTGEKGTMEYEGVEYEFDKFLLLDGPYKGEYVLGKVEMEG